MPFIKLSLRVFAFDMKELICVPCCSRGFAIFIVLRVSSLMCLASILTSSVVAVPKRLFENCPMKGNNERLPLPLMRPDSGISLRTVSIGSLSLMEVSARIVLICAYILLIKRQVALSS